MPGPVPAIEIGCASLEALSIDPQADYAGTLDIALTNPACFLEARICAFSR